jgi:tRNA G18 (ribose-2'-O)-methylase SpoU
MADAAPHRTVQRFRELARSSAKDEVEREILLDGLHLLFEARASGISIESAAFEESVLEESSARALAEQLSSAGADVFIVSRDVLNAMSPVKTPSGAVGIGRRSLTTLACAFRPVATRPAAAAFPSTRPTDSLRAGGAVSRTFVPSERTTVDRLAVPLAVIAHEIQDPGNVGGMIRTAEAAGATAFIACSGTADPLGWKALRGSMGSALRLPLARADITEALRECRKAGVATTALVPRGGTPFFTIDFRKPTALLLGGEGAGLPQHISQQADQRVSIPMHGRVESLNVGVAAALVLYEAFRQRTSGVGATSAV